MTAYRRLRCPGASYFFTVNLAECGSDLLVSRVDALRWAFAKTRAEQPFVIDAMVILPDHLHAVWTLPPGDTDFSTRWRLIKTRFSIATGGSGPRSQSKRAKQEWGLWQRRFWEHCLRSRADFDAHIRYCWGNPVKHGLVAQPADWPFSSIHRDMRSGMVEPEWLYGRADGEFGERREERGVHELV